MSIHDRLFTDPALKKFKVGLIVHKERFRENGRAEGVTEDVEAFLEVGIAIGPVCPDAASGEVLDGGFAKAGGELVCGCLADGCINAPAGGVHPFGAVSGSVDVNRHEDDVVLAVDQALGVGTAAAFLQGNVIIFRYQQLRVVAPVRQI